MLRGIDVPRAGAHYLWNEVRVKVSNIPVCLNAFAALVFHNIKTIRKHLLAVNHLIPFVVYDCISSLFLPPFPICFILFFLLMFVFAPFLSLSLL